MVFKNGVKNIQPTAYNGAHTVFKEEAEGRLPKNFGIGRLCSGSGQGIFIEAL